jgi:hypothetical protein
MKKTSRPKKLELKPQTIRNLTPSELQRAAGGLPPDDPGGVDTSPETKRVSCTCGACSDR